MKTAKTATCLTVGIFAVFVAAATLKWEFINDKIASELRALE